MPTVNVGSMSVDFFNIINCLMLIKTPTESKEERELHSLFIGSNAVDFLGGDIQIIGCVRSNEGELEDNSETKYRSRTVPKSRVPGSHAVFASFWLGP